MNRVVSHLGVIGGAVLGAALVAGVLAVPAIGATEKTRLVQPATAARALSGFTPAAADPRLAAVLARAGIDGSFRFTPAETRNSGKAVTVAVRTRSTRTPADERVALAAPTPTVGVAPIAYNLGVAVGWKRFAVSGDVSKVDLNGQPGSRDTADLAVTYSGTRLSGQVRASTDRPGANAVRLIDTGPSYSLDVGGSYSLTRNIDVTAGMRYKSERDRLVRFTDDRRDSQAVYVGTAFRF
jgi:hypothetical protein